MDSRPRKKAGLPPQQQEAPADREDRVPMPANVTTVMVEDLRARLVLAADRDAAILIDASQTQTIGQAGLQLLLAAQAEAERLNIPFAIENPRPELAARIVSLGLAAVLGVAPQEDMSS